MKRFSLRRSSKRSDVGHLSDAKFASLYEEADVDEDNDARPLGTTLRMLSSSKLGGVNQQPQRMFVCSKCRKGFQSSKALCGHMACHSVKEKALRKKKQLVIMDSQSDTESVAKSLRRRSRRGKCKKFDDHVADSRSKLDFYSNCSSEASGVEQDKVEEVAISLMMMSRDSGNWSGLNSIGDSSENNSVVLEVGSLGTNLVKKDGLRRLEYDVDDTLRKFVCKPTEALGDLECRYVRNGAKNIKSDVKFDNLGKNKLDKGSKADQHSSSSKFKSTEKPKMKLYSRPSGENGSHSVTNQYSNAEMHKRFEHRAGNHSQTDDGKGKVIAQHFSNNVGDYRKMGKKHECPICFNIFRSVQALGGHMRVHLAEKSDIDKCDEVSAIFKGNETRLHDLIDLNLPAPLEDEDQN